MKIDPRELSAQVVFAIGRQAARWTDREASAEDRYRARVLAGPIRGAILAMPRLERASFVTGHYEPYVVNAIQRHVRAGSIAYDIGAHIGYLSLVLARVVGPGGHVFAFEANSVNREALTRNVRRNAGTIVSVLPYAVTSTSGYVQFATFATYSLVGHIRGNAEPDDAEIQRVPAISLDDAVFRDKLPAPTFIKMDVEGAEADAIAGASRLLREVHPIIVAEVRIGMTWEAIDHMTRPLGYTAHWLTPPHTRGVADVLLIP